MSKRPKSGSFSYKIKHLIIDYTKGTINDNEFKEKIDKVLRDHPMQPVYAATAICRWLLNFQRPSIDEHKRYGHLTIKDVRHIANTITEINPPVGTIVYQWVRDTYSMIVTREYES